MRVFTVNVSSLVYVHISSLPQILKLFSQIYLFIKVPAFEGSDGTLLTESNAIAYYVGNDELRGGSDALARAQVVQWMCWADNEILPASCTWTFPCMGIMQVSSHPTGGGVMRGCDAYVKHDYFGSFSRMRRFFVNFINIHIKLYTGFHFYNMTYR